jgi:hypothetical protein
MAHRHPCYRHPRGVWMAACPDCTAWHRADRTEPRSEAAGDVAATEATELTADGDTERGEATAAA